MSANDHFVSLVSDGDRVTTDEIKTSQPRFVAQALAEIGAARKAEFSVGGPFEFVDIPGIGRFEQDASDDRPFREPFREWLLERAPEGGFTASSTDPEDARRLTEGDRRRVQFGASPEDVASDIQQEAEQVAAGSNSQTNSGASAGLLAALVGAVVLAVAVLGGD